MVLIYRRKLCIIFTGVIGMVMIDRLIVEKNLTKNKISLLLRLEKKLELI